MIICDYLRSTQSSSSFVWMFQHICNFVKAVEGKVSAELVTMHSVFYRTSAMFAWSCLSEQDMMHMLSYCGVTPWQCSALSIGGWYLSSLNIYIYIFQFSVRAASDSWLERLNISSSSSWDKLGVSSSHRNWQICEAKGNNSVGCSMVRKRFKECKLQRTCKLKIFILFETWEYKKCL